MKKKLVLIFLSFSILSFLVLNGRFLLANLRFFIYRDYTIQSQISWPVKGPDGKINISYENKLIFKDTKAGAILVIPKLKIAAPIIFDQASDYPYIYKSLESGVVHYSLTVKPGEAGPSIILGHSSALPWYDGKYGSVFALLGKLNNGDKFYVQYADGQIFRYSVKRSLLVDISNDSQSLNKLINGQEPSLLLISCWPIDVDYKRIIVEAVPVDKSE